MNDELMASAELGDEAKRFAESDLGRCMFCIASQEVAIAQERMESVDPDDAKKIREIQNEIKLHRNFRQWVLELIDKGEAALEVYRHEQEK